MDVVDQLVILSDAYKASVSQYENAVKNTKHLFTRCCKSSFGLSPGNTRKAQTPSEK